MKKRMMLKNNSDRIDMDVNHIDYNCEAMPSLVDLFGSFLKRKRLIGGVTLAVMILATVGVYLTPNRYISRASILPSGNVDKMAQLKSLAGFGATGNSDENSSELFPVILRSRQVAEGVLGKSYSFKHDGRLMELSCRSFLGHTNPDVLYDRLQAITSIAVSPSTGVIELEVETIYPGLSQAIARQYIHELEDFNLNKRRSGAGENERYLADQLEMTQLELERAEDSLECFQNANRNWDASSDPAMLKALGRLKRDIQLKSGTYVFLSEQYAAARFDAHKDVPIVRVLDEPSLPSMKSGPRRKTTILLSGVGAFAVMILLLAGIEIIRVRIRENETDAYHILRHDINQAFPKSVYMVSRVKRIMAEKFASTDK
ncbi:MAG: hypothetical protein JW763_07620 [candidate division Zixibacteria bacterium]|nr:hypothetical protein [candidate division Zixibacteria bacterium]